MVLPGRLMSLALLGAASFGVAPGGAAARAGWAPAAEARPTTPTLIASLPYGVGDGAVGLLPASESSPEGPAALTVTADGTIVILDGVDHVLERLDPDGRILPSVPLPGPGFEDLVALPSGDLLLLDRLLQRRLVQVDAQGGLVAAWPLPMDPEPGLATALLWSEGAFVEYEHGSSLPILDRTLRAVADPPPHAGRPDAGGAVRARRSGTRFVTLVVTTQGRSREAAVAFSADLLRLLGVERRPEGGVFLLAELAAPDGDGEGPVDTVRHEGVWLGAELREERRATTTHPWDPAQPLRALATDPTGGVIQLVPVGTGVQVLRW